MSAVTIGGGAMIVLVVLLAQSLRTARHKRVARGLVRRRHPTRSRRSGPRALSARLADLVARRRPSFIQPADALATVLDNVARRCSSGQSLAASFVAAAGASGGFRHAIAALHGGATIDEALGHEQSRHPDAALAIHVLRLCALQGGNVSESLDRAAATLRERHAARQERLAQAAQARLSARVLTVVPIAFACWTMLTTASVQRFMTTPAGFACAVVGVGLNLIGWSLMNRAIRGTA